MRLAYVRGYTCITYQASYQDLMPQKNHMVYTLAGTPRPQLEPNDKQTIDKDISALAFLFLPSSQGMKGVAGLFFSIDQPGTLFN